MPSENPAAVEEERLVSFMLDPASYEHEPKEVRLIQTHASLVFIAPPFVYKIKKPVDFGFLDYSSLEKRRHFCEQELRLNRRLCPEGYLEVIPITDDQGQLRLRGDGEPVEYALVMREFSADGFFDRKVEAGKATKEDIERIVEKLRGFYLEQKPTAEIEDWGRIDKLRVSTGENFDQTEPFVGRTITPAAFAAIRQFTNRFYEAGSELLRRRVDAGWIRDCHGDLHLEHIHLTPEHLHIYDCIEFNDRFRFVDVASDVAFLAMDLEYRGARDLARHFERRMVEALQDHDMPRLLPFYKCYRAYVRGKVESLQSAAAEADNAFREAAAERAARYFRLALRYAVAGAEPLLIAVMGRVASGKSTVAEQLSRELGWPVFASDKIRKQLAGVPLHQRGDEAAREALYAPKLSAAVYQEMQRSGINAARDNGGAVVDATFSSRDARSKLCRLAQGEGVRVVFVSVEASPQLRARRLQARDSEADVVSDARLQDMEMLDSRFEEAAANEGIECIKLQSTEDALDLEKLLVGLVECNAALHNAPSGGAA